MKSWFGPKSAKTLWNYADGGKWIGGVEQAGTRVKSPIPAILSVLRVILDPTSTISSASRLPMARPGVREGGFFLIPIQ